MGLGTVHLSHLFFSRLLECLVELILVALFLFLYGGWMFSFFLCRLV